MLLSFELNVSGTLVAASSVCKDLKEHLGAFRPTSGRLSCNFDYAPQSISIESVRAVGSIRLARKISQTLEQEPLPQREADLGLSEVVLSHTDQGVEAFDRALALTPGRSDLASDLAVALIARYEARGDSYDLLRALSTASRAVEEDPDSLLSRFNFALALEKLFLVGQAEKAWQDYQKMDSNSHWAEEAKDHLNALTKMHSEPLMAKWDQTRDLIKAAAAQGDISAIRRLISPFHQQVRTLLEEEVLPEWAMACLENRKKDSMQLLAMAHAIGDTLKQDGGDSLIIDAVISIETAGGERQKDLALGHKAFLEGVEFYKGMKDGDALQAFRRSYVLLEKGKSPFRYWALVKAGFSLIYLGEPQKVYVELEELSRSSELSCYPALVGRIRIALGITSGKLGSYSESFANYSSALADFSQVNETENVASSHFMLGQILQVQGERQSAWSHRYKALALTRELGNTVYLHNTLSDSADAALKEGFPEAALLFQTEMLLDNTAEKQPALMVEALLERAKTQLVVNRSENALRDLGNAERWLANMPATSRRIQLEAELWSTRAELELGLFPLRSLSLFTQSILTYKKRGDIFRLPTLYAHRAQARIALADFSAAEKDLQNGIEELEVQREHIAESALRESYLSQVRDVFDAMVCLQGISLLRYEKAFDYAERSRAKNLLDKAMPVVSEDSSGERIEVAKALMRELPPNAALIEYAVLDQKILAWVVTNRGLDQFDLNVNLQRLEGLVDHFNYLIREKGAPIKMGQAGEALYSALLSPLSSKLNGISEFVLVPDKFLYQVPFACLKDPISGRYLIEAASISYSPSGLLLLAALRKQKHLNVEGLGNILLVGNPAIDRSRFPSLADLHGADSEIRAIAPLYPLAKILSGAEASRFAFSSQASSYSVIHVAAHAIINRSEPLLSGIILSEDANRDSDNGIFSVLDIYNMKFFKTQIVVLASCEAASGRISKTEGIASLVTPFLAEGVPAIIASIWPTSDEGSAEMLVLFHRYLRLGLQAGKALRRAQLTLLHSNVSSLRNPTTWAGYELVGAGI